MLKRSIAIAGALVFSLSVHAGDSLKTQNKEASYAMGYQAGEVFHKNNVPLHIKSFIKGLKHGIKDKKPSLTKAQMQKSLLSFQQRVTKKIKAKEKKMSAANLAEGNAFLQENAKKEGVKTTKSGLQYKILEEGKGAVPTAKDTVEVDYEGKLIDGTVFDSSYQRGQSISFPVGGVIAGWTEALEMMPVGSTWMLYIPANLAYGERGTPGGPIGPNAALIFKVHLIAIKK